MALASAFKLFKKWLVLVGQVMRGIEVPKCC